MYTEGEDVMVLHAGRWRSGTFRGYTGLSAGGFARCEVEVREWDRPGVSTLPTRITVEVQQVRAQHKAGCL